MSLTKCYRHSKKQRDYFWYEIKVGLWKNLFDEVAFWATHDRKDLANHIRELKRHVNLHLQNTKEGKHRGLLGPVRSWEISLARKAWNSFKGTSNAMPTYVNFILKSGYSGRFLSIKMTWSEAYVFKKLLALCIAFLLIFYYFQYIFGL